jgi:hypothetical protein
VFQTLAYYAEVVGATLYLLNKICFLLRETAGARGDETARRRWAALAWGLGLLGLPFVTAVLIGSRDWIFGFLELGAAPPMLFGLIVAMRGDHAVVVPRWADRVVYVAIVVGILYSAYDLGGLLSFPQMLELGAALTFIWGSYELAKGKPVGYLVYVAMFACAGTLLFIQEHYWFALQQLASAAIIYGAYIIAARRSN